MPCGKPHVSDKQMRNLHLHGDHIHAIATEPAHHRNAVLKHATPELVQALCTALRLLDQQGVKFAPAHARRSRRMISRNTARRTKKQLVSGKHGAQSRGGAFFSDVCKMAMPLVEPSAGTTSGGGFLDDLGDYVVKVGDVANQIVAAGQAGDE